MEHTKSHVVVGPPRRAVICNQPCRAQSNIRTSLPRNAPMHHVAPCRNPERSNGRLMALGLDYLIVLCNQTELPWR